jgi:hypothetical protein
MCSTALGAYPENLLWRSSDGDFLRSGAHGLNGRSAPVPENHREPAGQSDFPDRL